MKTTTERFGKRVCKSPPMSNDPSFFDHELEIPSTRGERAITWLSYYTLVFSASAAFAPGSAAAAVQNAVNYLG